MSLGYWILATIAAALWLVGGWFFLGDLLHWTHGRNGGAYAALDELLGPGSTLVIVAVDGTEIEIDMDEAREAGTRSDGGLRTKVSSRMSGYPLTPKPEQGGNAATEWRVVVNGQPILLPITPETRFDRILGPALEATGNTRYPERLWEIRDGRGRLLWRPQTVGGFETVGPLVERGEIVEECLSVNLQPGVGA